MPWQFSTLSPSAAQATPRTSAWSGVVRACDVERHGPSTPQHVKSHRTEVLQFRFGDCGSLQTTPYSISYLTKTAEEEFTATITVAKT